MLGIFSAAVGFVVVGILAVRLSLTSRITSPPLAAGRPLLGRPCALALCKSPPAVLKEAYVDNWKNKRVD